MCSNGTVGMALGQFGSAVILTTSPIRMATYPPLFLLTSNRIGRRSGGWGGREAVLICERG